MATGELGRLHFIPLIDLSLQDVEGLKQLSSEVRNILVLDLGVDAAVETHELEKLKRYVEWRSNNSHDEIFAAHAIVGNLDVLQDDPELIVELQPDGVWSRWTSSTEIQAALKALEQKIRLKRRSDKAITQQHAEEKSKHAQERVLNLLDALGYAYFVCDPDGSPVVSSRQEKRLLEIAGNNEDSILKSNTGEAWWVYPDERRDWLDMLGKKGIVIQYPALLRTYLKHYRWVNIDCRFTMNPDTGNPVLEGIYQDATQPKFSERLSNALATVGSAAGGVRETMEIVCHAAAYLFEVNCAVLMGRAPWEGQEERIFPMHIWYPEGDARAQSYGPEYAGPLSRSSTFLLAKPSDIPWIHDIDHSGPVEIHRSHVRPSLRALFPGLVDLPNKILVIPLPQTPSNERENPGDALQAYLWLPITQQLTFEPKELWPAIQSFLRLCSRQLLLAANRDAFTLVHQVLAPIVPPVPSTASVAPLAGFSELCSALDLARLALTQQMGMEGCSIFYAGIEDRKRILSLATTSGLIQAAAKSQPTYELGEGLMGTIALRQRPYLSFGISDEPAAKNKHVEHTTHSRQTWLGVPLLSRDTVPRTVGMIRCVNRTLTLGNAQHVTGFSALDIHVLVEFGRACALLIELSQVQEMQRRTLSRVSHELRSPAVGLRNNILYFRDHFGSREFRDHFGSREEHILDKLRTKIDDLELDVQVLINLLAQVDLLRGKGSTAPREPAVEVSVKDVIHKTLNQLTPELKARDLPRNNITTQFSEALPLFRLPRAAFTQVIFNLFMNAIKYSTRKDFRFVIYGRWTSKELGHYEVGLRDWGIGVDEKYQDKIFDGEFRTPQAQRHDPTGLGLGLTISRKIMRDLGGDLVMVSCKNPTEFVLHLPAELAVR